MYEYKKTGAIEEEELNELGQIGWELVGVSQWNLFYGQTVSISYIFKRLKK